jgi:AraC family transcriptional regulator
VAIPLDVLTSAFEVEATVIESAQMCLLPRVYVGARRRKLDTAFQMLGSVFREAESRSASAGLLVDAAALAIAALLLGDQLPSRDDEIPKLDAIRLARAIDVIESNLAINLQLNELAAVACISSYHFARSFKAATGLTPHSYVQSRRITRAKELLARTRAPIAQIAADVGFASQAHMTDVFREKVGATPARYRADRQR